MGAGTSWRLWGVAALALAIGAGPSVVPAPTPPVPSAPAAAAPESATRGAGEVVPVAHRSAAPRVLFVGDSLAAQMGHHAAVALHEAGVETRVAAVWGIGLFTRDQYDMGRLQPDPPEGTLLRMASDAVAEFDPDVVAVYSNHNYWPPHPRDASGRPLQWTSPGFPEMARTLLTDLVTRLRAGGATVYLIAPIPLFPPDDQPEENPIWDAYLKVREELGVEVLTPGDLLWRPDGERHETLPDCTGAPRRVRPEDDVHLTYFGAGLMGGRAARAVAERLPTPPTRRPATWPTAPGEPPVALVPAASGYRLVTCDGATFHFGRQATAAGSAADGQGRTPSDPVVAATSAGSPPGSATLLLTRAGEVLRLDAVDPGAGGPPPTGDAAATVVARIALRPGRRAVGIAAVPPSAAGARTGRGFWVATSDGRVDAVDGAPHHGDAAPLPAGEEAVALTATPDGGGYLLLTSAGRVLPFGSAAHHGDLAGGPDAPDAAGVPGVPGVPGVEPVALAVHPGGDGYWVLERDGTVHAFGAAGDHGSAVAVDMWHQTLDRHSAGLPPLRLPAAEAPAPEAVALLPTATGRGYWLALASGAVCHFGDAPTLGGVHRAEVDPLMTYVGEPYYDEGPCTPPPHDRLLALSSMYAGIRAFLAGRQPSPAAQAP
ncbi:MAG TPA: SGNH hydrolase domain-containing protein [Acidimicrobiales bacterium]